MADTKIFAGPRVRRIRTSMELTQTAMAEELGISPSYLNLIERNQRPLTAQLVLKLVSTYQVAPEDLQPTGEAGSVPALREVFADPLLSGELPGPQELLELSDGAPNAAIGIVKLYRAYREQQERLSDLSRLMGEGGQIPETSANQMPVDAVRSVFENNPWCFPSLERAAERILKALGDDQELMASIYNLLRSDHGLAVQVLPVETMPIWRKRLDKHSGRLFVSERLQRADRVELLVQELVLRRESDILDEEIELLKIEGDEAKRLARMELSRYTALCVLMPYDRFLRAAERLSYDPLLLATRFETGFSQVAERLVSLQDKSAGHRVGLPFFALQVDQGGNLLRKVGAKGFPTARFGGGCPKLAIHAAFSKPDEMIAERVVSSDGTVYLTLSKTIDGPFEGAGDRPRRTAVLLGLEDAQASKRLLAANEGSIKRVSENEDSGVENLAYARLLPDPIRVPPLPIGPSCRLCERTNCAARSAPPITRPLGLDDLVQGFGAYGLT